MKLENDRLLAAFSQTDGCLTRLFDKKLRREYLADSSAVPPFRVMTECGILTPPAVFSCRLPGDGSLTLSWAFEGASLQAFILLLEDGLSFRAALQNSPRSDFRVFEYPLIGPLKDYGKSGFLAHSYATGILVSDPLRSLPEVEGPRRYLPYPESFSGASMQFFTYYEEGRGGLYFAAKDGEAHQKWLNFYVEKGQLLASHMYGYEEIGPGTLLDMPYAFELRLTAGDGWEEAAELYKPWALRQRWARRGRAWDRGEREKAVWLLEEAGAATFGINAGHDRTKWLNRYRKDIGTRIFHILGPDWTRQPQNFYNSLPGDLEDWAPDNFSQANLDNLKRHGDPFAAFEFDFFVGLDKTNPGKLRPHLQRFPDPGYSHDGYRFSMLCPADPFTKAFHREKNLRMLRRAGMDAMYYDISANNLIKICLAENHGHKPGGGQAITEGYQEVYRDTKQALDAEAGKYIPLGTEMMNETLLSELDFYQARAWAQPSSTLETWPLRGQMRNGSAKMIPLFSFVYHTLGTVRLDGWGKLVEETGSYFYYIVSRVYLWGGLYELNHEYSPMEALDGEETRGEEHYFRFDPQGCAYSEKRARYLRQFAFARTGAASPYWAYGEMKRLPPLRLPETEYSWYHYNHGQQDSSYKARGVYQAEAIVAACYAHPESGCALFLANATESAQPVTLALSHAALDLPHGDKTLSLRRGFGGERLITDDLGRLREGEKRELCLTLVPLTLYMLEIL